MSVRFSVLASGSRGNSALIRTEGAGLLIDLGLGPKVLGERLESVGASWDGVGAALLTHTHGDHVGDHALANLARRRVALYCHEGHRAALGRLPGFSAVEAAGLLRHYDDRPFLTPTGLRVEPVELRHDGGPAFGFRVEARGRKGKRPVAIGLIADTGCWTQGMADLMTDVDLLGVEFNHDVALQKASDRHPALIRRNLGDRGHLSNRQGADFVSEVLKRSGRGAVRHLVLLHLSEQCNRPELALKAARGAARSAGRRLTVHVARQHPAHPDVGVEPGRRLPPPARADGPAPPRAEWLPF